LRIRDNSKKSSLLGFDTLVPISFITVLTAVIYFISQLNSQAQSNSLRLSELETLSGSRSIRIYDRLNAIDKDIGELKSTISRVDGKLDLLIELGGPARHERK